MEQKTKTSQYSDIGFDEEFDKMLIVKKLFYGKIVRVTRDFYKVYIRKCNEYDCYMDFFEVLYAYLIGYGFSDRKISTYISKVKENLLEKLKKLYNIVQ